MKKIDLSIIILNYNAGKFLEKCLASILGSRFQVSGISGIKTKNPKPETNNLVTEIIVVDNNSTDGSVKYPLGFGFQVSGSSQKRKSIRNQKPNTRNLILIRNNQNLGFAAGNNIGVRAAHGEYVLFLNPDTVVLPGAIEGVLNFMKAHPRAGAATCQLELANGQLDKVSHRGFPTPWRSFCHFSGLEKFFPKSKFFAGYSLGHLLNKSKAHQIDSCSGAFMMVPRKVGQKVGWWDEDYFFYGEDIDFCYRIKKLGKKIYFLPQVKIIHYRGVSSGIKKHSQKISKANLKTKVRATKASTEAMRIFYRKHYLKKYPKIIYLFVLIGVWLIEKYRIFKIKKT